MYSGYNNSNNSTTPYYVPPTTSTYGGAPRHDYLKEASYADAETIKSIIRMETMEREEREKRARYEQSQQRGLLPSTTMTRSYLDAAAPIDAETLRQIEALERMSMSNNVPSAYATSTHTAPSYQQDTSRLSYQLDKERKDIESNKLMKNFVEVEQRQERLDEKIIMNQQQCDDAIKQAEIATEKASNLAKQIDDLTKQLSSAQTRHSQMVQALNEYRKQSEVLRKQRGDLDEELVAIMTKLEKLK